MLNEYFDFPFYKWEKELSNKPFLRQPFGDNWETYTWSEAGMMARKLATGLKSLGLKEKSHIGLVSKIAESGLLQILRLQLLDIFLFHFFQL